MPVTVTVTGLRFADASGNPENGYVSFTPSATLKDAHGNTVLAKAPIIAPVAGGVMAPQALLATDAAYVVQSGWVWLAQEFVSDGGVPVLTRGYSFSLPSTLGASVDLAALRGVGNPAALITANPMTVTGTPTSGQVLTATGGSTANWQAAGGGSGTPASTVQGATSYGIASAVGTDTTYAREDHQHGTPSLTTTAPATTLGIGTAAALGSATLPAHADHVHPVAAAATPTASAVTDTASTGNATTFAASNHVHGREGFGTVTALSTFGTSSSSGSATTVSHSDHVHGAPALPTSSTSTQGIVQLDGTSTDIQALGTQAAGSSGLAADAKHVHPTTGLVLASQLPLSLANGGTGQTSAQAAMNALAGATTSGQYLRGSGSNVVMAAIAAGDLPTGTTSAQGALLLDGTATDITADGIQAAGSIGKAADAGHVHPAPTGVFLASDTSFLAWNYDPAFMSTGQVLTTGVVYLVRINVRSPMTVTNVILFLSTAGASLTANESFAGLYNSSGTLIGATADQSTAWTSGSAVMKTMALAGGPYALTTGYYWVGIVSNGGTQPTFGRWASFALTSSNAGLAAAGYRWATNGTGTSLANITPSANSSYQQQLWAALS